MVLAPLTSNELAELRLLAPSNREWQDRVDQLVVEMSHGGSGLFPPTLWGDFMSRLRRGEQDAWDAFVRRYQGAIAASIRSLVGARLRGDVEDFVTEFISWLYLPKQSSSAGRVAERLDGLRLTDNSGEHVYRFRGWLYETLRRWLGIKARDEARRISMQAARVTGELSATMRESAIAARRIDEALVCHAADVVLESLREDSNVHYRALLDLLRSEDLEATSRWLRSEHLPASAASASRARTRAAQLFRERLLSTHQSRFGGQESEVLLHIPALAAHLAASAESLAAEL